ncbi:hypothetical protein [Aminobacter sp. MDW-2]|uniref:hypothetical protein n=1 Tax=Aminobacter sp. MDW-2 TaxID=2666139 RepID=UPI0012AF8812|nr:hypothetical protein [Aminobacter sp. MDW-2]MRX33184.1 hypothetical protein [Aminobacter sp. MDW-2]QNH36809.1 hypothetical protein H5P29_13435 [Aminobacter sp. MDW-2]
MALLAPELQVFVRVISEMVVDVRNRANDLDDPEKDRFALPAPPFLAWLRPNKAQAIVAFWLGRQEFAAASKAPAQGVIVDAAFLAAVPGAAANALADFLPFWRFD